MSRRFVGDAVDVVTGACIVSETDYVLGGPIRLRWRRHYNSMNHLDERGIGAGFRHGFDRELKKEDDGVVYVDPTGVRIYFPPLERDGERYADNGTVLERVESVRYRVCQRGRPTAELVFRDLREPARLSSLVTNTGWIKVRYRSSGRLAAIRTSEGEMVELLWEGGRIVGLLLERGSNDSSETVVSYRYSQDGKLIEASCHGERRSTYEYDDTGRLSAKRFAGGYVVRYEYDESGRCLCRHGEDGRDEIRAEYFPAAEQTIIVRGDDSRWIFTYAEDEKIRHVLDPCQGATSYTIDHVGCCVDETDPARIVWKYELDWTDAPLSRSSGGRCIPLIEGANILGPNAHRVGENALEWAFGDLFLAPDRFPDVYAIPAWLPSSVIGELKKREGLGSQRSSFELDERGRPVREVFPDGGIRSCGYDAHENVIWFEDLDHSRYEYEFDPIDLPRKFVDPTGASTRFEHSRSGTMSAVRDPLETRSDFALDPLERLIEVRRNGRLRERYVRDAVGNIVEKVGPDENTILRSTWSPGNLKVSCELESGRELTFSYDAQGMLEEARSDAGLVEIDHDQCSGKRTKDLRDGRGVEHVFGVDGTQSCRVLGRFETRYELTALDTLCIIDPTGGKHEVRLLGFGLVTLELSNGTREVSQYDLHGRCLLKAISGTSSPEWAWTRRFEHSGEGDLLRAIDNASGETNYEHDAAHRLVEVHHGDEHVAHFSYDAAGNLLHLADVELGYAPGNLLTSVNGRAVDHDARNHLRMLDDAEKMYWYYYDVLDQLVQIKCSDGRIVECSYDGLGRRTVKRIDERQWLFYWDTDRLAAEQMPDGTLRVFVYPDEMAIVPMLYIDYESDSAAPESGRVHFVHTDHLGCPILVRDDKQRDLWRALIKPYGEAEVTLGEDLHQPLRFPGHYCDEELGIHHTRFRAYLPRLGRFLQSNPLGVAGGINLHSYPASPVSEVNVLGLRTSSARGGGTFGLQPDLRPDAEGTKPLMLTGKLGSLRSDARELGDIRALKSQLFATINTCRQLLNHDPDALKSFEDDLFELEKKCNHVMNDEDLLVTSFAKSEYSRLLEQADAFETKIREHSPPAEEPPTFCIAGGRRRMSIVP